MIPAHLRAVIIDALTEYEHSREAFYDGLPDAMRDAALAREALAWLEQEQPPSPF